jgi:uncharacterized membrane protein
MTKEEFLRILRQALAKVPVEDREEMVYDYEEHIRIAQEQGISEEDAVRALGPPRTIAKELLADYYVQRAEEKKSLGNITRAVLATVSLGFFNLVFVSGPFFAAFGVLMAFYGTSLAFIFVPLAAVLGFAVASAFTPFGLFSLMWSGSAIFPLLTIEGLGLLFLVATIYLTKWAGELFLTYLKFNLRIIKGGE